MLKLRDRLSHTDLARRYLESLPPDSLIWSDGAWYRSDDEDVWREVPDDEIRAAVFRNLSDLSPDIDDVNGVYQIARLGRHAVTPPEVAGGQP